MLVYYSNYMVLPHLFILVLLTKLSLQVNIILSGPYGLGELVNPGYRGMNRIVATCTDIPPGVCCQGPRDMWSGEATNITFEHLTFLDIAAVWEARRSDDETWWISGCSGQVKATRNGPGTWRWDDQFGRHSWGIGIAYGASYITLPANAPFGADTISALVIQGILGLAWVRISKPLDLFCQWLCVS